MNDQAHTRALALLVPCQQSVTLKIKGVFLAHAWVEKCSLDKNQTSQDLSYHFQYSHGGSGDSFYIQKCILMAKCQGVEVVRTSGDY